MLAVKSRNDAHSGSGVSEFFTWGLFWLLIALISAGIFFQDGINALLVAWQLPEYSHGPLIPVLSAFLLFKQMRDYPPEPGPKANRWPGLVILILGLILGALGSLAGIADISAYGLILWIGGLLLISFGWSTGKHFWHGIVHLVYMLPLPGIIYYKTTTSLQFVSSELGVWFLRLMDVPVFLDGNIIDLGVLKLHVAEACSGLRYMFPIMSFSYIFAMLYRGPVWHKITLLLAAVPIAIVMNSVRIAVAGVIVQYYGDAWLEGFTHFFEGWVIFLSCIFTTGLGAQMMRIQLVQPSMALITATVLGLAGVAALQMVPERGGIVQDRDSFVLFPRSLGEWRQVGPRQVLSPSVSENLGADDYHQISLTKPDAPVGVGLFMAWYNDQSKGGVHSPEICLPGSGWEIAWLERSDITAQMESDTPFRINRAIIQQGESRMMVYYWFQQKHRRIAWDFAAKYWLMIDGLRTGRTDGALVRLTTQILPGESDATAEARLQEVLHEIQDPLPRFIPEE